MTAPLFQHLAQGPEGGQAHWRMTPDGARLRLVHWPAARARGTVLLFNGRSEYAEKYGPAATRLTAAGWHVVTLDWRGQGLSSRHHPDPMLGHVGDFAEYQQDVAALMGFMRESGLPEPLHLLAHSMGGCIGLRSLLQGLPVRSAALSAPMWGIRLFPTVTPVAMNLSWLAHQAGHGHRLTPTTTRVSYVLHAGFRGNLLTRDPEMWTWMRQHLTAEPGLALGGPTLTWLHAAFTEMTALMRAPAPNLPAYVALGTRERIVCPRSIRRRLSTWTGARLEPYTGAEHEVMMEVPRHREHFLQACLTLFDHHS
ncbi:alpha/beta hydrolase [Gemmobacter denitrificans]|uniref:Alpha/beta hydrolase n=1 Tax=Gemmobacter denitrificans TaxID=3123040 RepID=A0ABU8BSB8_9RHOB